MLFFPKLLSLKVKAAEFRKLMKQSSERAVSWMENPMPAARLLSEHRPTDNGFFIG